MSKSWAASEHQNDGWRSTQRWASRRAEFYESVDVVLVKEQKRQQLADVRG
jgi:hypothetical protein